MVQGFTGCRYGGTDDGDFPHNARLDSKGSETGQCLAAALDVFRCLCTPVFHTVLCLSSVCASCAGALDCNSANPQATTRQHFSDRCMLVSLRPRMPCALRPTRRCC